MAEKPSAYRLEYASSARAKCKGPKPCKGTIIQKGELRVGSLIDFKGKTSFAWRHWECTTEKVLGNMKKSFEEPAQLDGYEHLKPEDQARIVKAWEEGHIDDADIHDSARKPDGDDDEDERKPQEEKAPRKGAEVSEGEAVERPKRSGDKAKKADNEDDDQQEEGNPKKGPPNLCAKKADVIGNESSAEDEDPKKKQAPAKMAAEPKEKAAPKKHTLEKKKDWDDEDSEESGEEFPKKLTDVWPKSDEEDKPKKASAKTPVSKAKAGPKKKPDEVPSTTTSPSTHGNRTLPTSSLQWGALRAEILLRDDRTCSACGYRSPHPKGRGMVIDHANGDASNNDPSNLRIYCPLCEAVRHYGFAGLHNCLVVGESNVAQVEIVRKTREMFERTGVIPHPKLIDPSVVLGNIGVLELANIMLKTTWKDLPEERGRLRGFFTGSSSHLFQKTMFTETKEPDGDSNEALSVSDRRAAEIAAREAGLPWISYSKKLHKSAQGFLNSWLPSKTSQRKVAWIYVRNDRAVRPKDPDLDGLSTAWNEMCTESVVTLSKLDKLAGEFNVLSGKWLVFVPTDQVDNLWGRIVTETLAGTMGCSAKVSPCEEGDPAYRHVICVYNADYRNKAEVNQVRDNLRRLGVKQRIGYKPDIYTHCRIYMGNSWNIPPSRYHD